MPRQLFATNGYTVGIEEYSERQGLAVTATDGLLLPGGSTRGIYVTGAGNVSGTLATGGTFVLTGLTAGQTVRINVSIIAATGTTATGIYALYPAGNL